MGRGACHLLLKVHPPSGVLPFVDSMCGTPAVGLAPLTVELGFMRRFILVPVRHLFRRFRSPLLSCRLVVLLSSLLWLAGRRGDVPFAMPPGYSLAFIPVTFSLFPASTSGFIAAAFFFLAEAGAQRGRMPAFAQQLASSRGSCGVGGLGRVLEFVAGLF